MKESEILQAVLNGQKLIVGDFRDWDSKELPDQKNAGQFNVIESTYVLVGRDVVPVERFAPKGKRKSDLVRPAFKVGERVVVEWKSWANTKWGLRVSGEVQLLTK